MRSTHYTYSSAIREASSFPNRKALHRLKNSLYVFLKKNNWLDVIFPAQKFRDAEKAKTLAKTYISRTQLAKQNVALYRFLSRHHLLDEVLPCQQQ